jgi:hypothetical protein
MQQSIYFSFGLYFSVSHGIAIYSLIQSLHQCTSLYKYLQAPCNNREKGTRDPTPCSKMPMYLFSSSGTFTETKQREHATVVTTSIWVLPHPGGPYKRTLERSLKGALAKSSPCLIGVSNTCYTNSQLLRHQHESIWFVGHTETNLDLLWKMLMEFAYQTCTVIEYNSKHMGQ